MNHKSNHYVGTYNSHVCGQNVFLHEQSEGKCYFRPIVIEKQTKVHIVEQISPRAKINTTWGCFSSELYFWFVALLLMNIWWCRDILKVWSLVFRSLYAAVPGYIDSISILTYKNSFRVELNYLDGINFIMCCLSRFTHPYLVLLSSNKQRIQSMTHQLLQKRCDV